jgi:hemerythrin-like domain-containing protein
MAATDSFRKQHGELLAVAGEIGKTLDPAQLAKDATQARTLLSSLAGKLKVHLAMEDKTLYPRLMQDPDPKVSGLAKRFADEMGGIAEVFGGYMERWPSGRAIQEAPQQFVADTKKLFAALATRIERENNQLYPLLDARG